MQQVLIDGMQSVPVPASTAPAQPHPCAAGTMVTRGCAGAVLARTGTAQRLHNPYEMLCRVLQGAVTAWSAGSSDSL